MSDGERSLCASVSLWRFIFVANSALNQPGHATRIGLMPSPLPRLAALVSCAALLVSCRMTNTPALRVYVTNEASGDLTVIDAAAGTVLQTIKVGKRPRGIKVSPDKKFLYVALSGSPNAGPGVDPKTLPPPDRASDGIGEVDTSSNTLTRIIHAGVDPEQLDISADGTRLYVANEDAAQVSVVDVKSGAIIGTAKVGDEPEGVAIRPDGKVVYVTSEEEGEVAVIDTATRAVLKRIEVGHRPRSIGFLPDGSRAFVTLENDAALAVVDSVRHEFVHTLPLGDQTASPKPRPMGIAMRPDGSMFYVTSGSFGRLFFVDPAREQVAGSVEVGRRPWGVALLPDGRTLVTANGPSNDVSIVDVMSQKVVKKIPVGERPWGIAVVDRASR
jgi:YVTN family beta-propeller protein